MFRTSFALCRPVGGQLPAVDPEGGLTPWWEMSRLLSLFLRSHTPMTHEVLECLRACRSIVRDFVSKKIDYSEYCARMNVAMDPLDPLDWALQGLTEDQSKEAMLYVDWIGGEFGETRHLIPHRPDWVYGQCQEPYGWVDQEEYRRRLRMAFAAYLDAPS